jgi:hypothetical protein
MVSEKAYNQARGQAVKVLIENHQVEFDRLFLLARRGELNVYCALD